MAAALETSGARPGVATVGADWTEAIEAIIAIMAEDANMVIVDAGWIIALHTRLLSEKYTSIA